MRFVQVSCVEILLDYTVVDGCLVCVFRCVLLDQRLDLMMKEWYERNWKLLGLLIQSGFDLERIWSLLSASCSFKASVRSFKVDFFFNQKDTRSYCWWCWVGFWRWRGRVWVIWWWDERRKEEERFQTLSYWHGHGSWGSKGTSIMNWGCCE